MTELGSHNVCRLKFKISERAEKGGKVSNTLATTTMNVLLNKTMKPQCMYVCKLTAAVIICS